MLLDTNKAELLPTPKITELQGVLKSQKAYQFAGFLSPRNKLELRIIYPRHVNLAQYAF